MEKARATFSKRERIVSKKLVEELFDRGNSHALTAFPLRMVYMLRERAQGDEPVQVLISKRLRHAVDRNRVKRQVREAYRQNKQTLLDVVPEGQQMVAAFVWQSEQLSPTASVEGRVKNLLRRAAERL